MAARRGNGEGTLYRTRDGRWRGQASLAGRRPGVSGRTRAEAARRLRQLLAACHEPVGGASGTTLADLLDRWLEEEVRPTRRPRTHRLYRDLARLHLLPALGTTELAALQAREVRQLYAALLARGLAPKTVRNVHHVLRGALHQAVAWRLVAHNAAGGAPLARLPHREMAILDPGQVRRLSAAAAGGRWAAPLALALATGMRQGELLGLRWADGDLEAGLVQVRRQLGRDGALAVPPSAAPVPWRACRRPGSRRRRAGGTCRPARYVPGSADPRAPRARCAT